MIQNPRVRRAAAKFALVGALTGTAGAAVGLPLLLTSVAAPAAAEPEVNLLHAGHDVEEHGGYGSVPGVENGVSLMEYGDNTLQTVLLGGTPKPFLVDVANYQGPAYFSTSDALPKGLTLNSDGTWTGTASEKVTVKITVEVSNDTTSFDLPYQLNVVGPDEVGVASWTAAASNDAQTIATNQAPAPMLGRGPADLYFGSLDEMPPGLTLRTDGTWAGTATTPGVYTLDVYVSTVFNNEGVKKTFVLTVTQGAAFGFSPLASNTTQTASVGSYYALPLLEVTGSREELDFTVVKGDIPPGMSFSKSGQLTGTPASTGTFVLEIKATNKFGESATTKLTVVVTATPATAVKFTDDAINDAQQIELGQSPVAVKATALPVGQLSYKVMSGAVPAGLTLNADGTWDGKSSAASVAPLSIMATVAATSDGAVYTDTTTLVLTVMDKRAPGAGDNKPGVITAPVPDVEIGRAPDTSLAPGAVPAPTGDQLTPTGKGTTPTDVSCSTFGTKEEAQLFLDSVGGADPYGLDEDSDGIACEALPSAAVKVGGAPILAPVPGAETPAPETPAVTPPGSGELEYQGEERPSQDAAPAAELGAQEQVASSQMAPWVLPAAVGGGLFILVAGGATFWALKRRQSLR